MTWEGCYDDSWKGLIVPDAFRHPAKFAYGLITRIVDHGLAQTYWREGDVIGDPSAVGLAVSPAPIAAFAGTASRSAAFCRSGTQNFPCTTAN
jgi:hypothetical protein